MQFRLTVVIHARQQTSPINHSGRFRRETRRYDPFGNLKRDVWGYYDTTPKEQVERPPSGKHSFLSLAQVKTIGDHYSGVRGC